MKQILLFVLFAGLICWMMFSPIYKHVLIVRQAVLQQEVDYLLEVGASGSYGYIGPVMLEQAKSRMEAFGLKRESILFEVKSESGVNATNPSAPLPRGTGLSLTASYPYENLFQIDRLIGISPPPANGRMKAFGMKMSEYVP
ncbi:hypothetical protein [Paenibacillus sp. 2TAB19]|uniref:hypothetical protein n=1 Tax=Paenibacillus sp. 2TAB19 TaxID=3233003 RepID=UPI003F945740